MPHPNILFITCHDLGRHLGSYGHATVDSAALDALATSGVRFNSAFCTAPQCSPSRASLHTGRYPHATGVLGLAHPPFGWRLPPHERHLAHMLRDHGYATCLVGMQHLIAHGRAEELGYERVLLVAPARESAAAAVGVLRDLAMSDRPFYLELGFEEPHRPFDFGDAELDTRLGVAVPPYLPDGAEARHDFAAFQGAIRRMDQGAGVVLRGLDDLGLAANTWVIFTADHGAPMPRAKATLYDPGIEVALLMRWPDGNIGTGQVHDHLVSNVDVVPTMLDGLGLDLPGNLHGRSFWPLLRDASYQRRQAIFVEKTFHTHYEPMRGVRTATHKYIVNFEVGTAVDVPADVQQSPIYSLLISDFGRVRDQVEMYDLTVDPWEIENIAGSADIATVETELRHRLQDWMIETDDPLLTGPIASPYYRASIERLDG